MRIGKNGFVHRLLKERVTEAERIENESALYKVALENAYEGIVIADAKGIVLTASRTYASFLQLELADMIGRHVTDVIPNTRLHIVADTGKAEIADLQQIHGHWMIASRVPIKVEGEVVAVVGKIMFQDIDSLFEINEKFRELKEHLHYNEAKSRDVSGAKYDLDHVAGTSDSARKLRTMAERVAKSRSAVLITGESGTGKELFAHAIHRISDRRFGPFVAVNCAAIPEALFESEMFGYKEGAFTGARRSGRKGKMAQANKGTLFLDEIGELPLPMQAKLLRALQEGEIEPVGGDRSEPIDVRIIAATNKDLGRLVREGSFRQDLYYRLHVIPLAIPPLRERKEDIPVIANALLPQLAKDTGIAAKGIGEDYIQALMKYSWPGNVRELRNVLERSLYRMEGVILDLSSLPEELTDTAAAAEAASALEQCNSLQPVAQVRSSAVSYAVEESWKSRMQDYEKQLIQEALSRAGGDKLRAAEFLGMSKSSFYQKLDQYGISNRQA